MKNAILSDNMEEGMNKFLHNKNGSIYKMIGIPLLNFVPLKRFGQGDDIKETMVFIASKQVVIFLDGGFTINAGI